MMYNNYINAKELYFRLNEIKSKHKKRKLNDDDEDYLDDEITEKESEIKENCISYLDCYYKSETPKRFSNKLYVKRLIVEMLNKSVNGKDLSMKSSTKEIEAKIDKYNLVYNVYLGFMSFDKIYDLIVSSVNCDICSNSILNRSKRVPIEHLHVLKHKTNKFYGPIRKVLCDTCNTKEGILTKMINLIEYNNYYSIIYQSSCLDIKEQLKREIINNCVSRLLKTSSSLDKKKYLQYILAYSTINENNDSDIAMAIGDDDYRSLIDESYKNIPQRSFIEHLYFEFIIRYDKLVLTDAEFDALL